MTTRRHPNPNPPAAEGRGPKLPRAEGRGPRAHSAEGRGQSALICGVSGQDGAYLSRLLLEKGYRVVGTSRDAQLNPFSGLVALGIRERVEAVSMSLNDFRSVLQVLDRVAPDEVYNLAGQTSVGLSFEQPVETMESISIGTLNLLEAIRFLGAPVRLYNACSSECFGNTGGKPADETTPFRPSSPYAVAKAAAFWQVANYRDAYQLYACSGILFNHESPLRPARFVTRKIVEGARLIAAGELDVLRLGDIGVARDWGWAPEYVEAMWRMLQEDEPDDYVIATGEMHTVRQFCDRAFAARGIELEWRGSGLDEKGIDTKTGNPVVAIDETHYRPSDIRALVGNATKAAEKLGWTASTTFDDLITRL